MNIYTDGSCIPNPGKGGWAFIAVCENEDIISYDGKAQTTNNEMEMTAVIKALKYFKTETKFKFFTDSQYVINCATGKWKRKMNLPLWEKYEKYAKGKTIEFVWVKGHSGNEYNGKVDRLANRGREEYV